MHIEHLTRLLWCLQVVSLRMRSFQ